MDLACVRERAIGGRGVYPVHKGCQVHGRWREWGEWQQAIAASPRPRQRVTAEQKRHVGAERAGYGKQPRRSQW